MPRRGDRTLAQEEYFEIVNDAGEVIGLAPRSKCHGDPALAHRSVHVFVKNRAGDLFLQKRSQTKDIQPGKWDTSVGGHLCPGETYEEAAWRELQEELGVKPQGADRPALIERHRYVWRSPVETEHVCTFEMIYEGPFRLQEEEIEEGRFWTAAEIQEAVGRGILTTNLEHELRLLGV
ncbi:MAG: NUDIX domain-containing protein [Acidobacteria bacterium]|nr:MAG: NUDIX domain-containing protein [Acidobacteriota bacterium]